ncbi:MAG: hypothetical protein COX57_09845 [Alphaproteobacteria bacterium CG_4_10_14_0_2_um_filter_63_37]|nr:MAG: hypothetical protein AUJ55_02740 [Proteobacteria bacterium CG1_02_64_396]PJA24179.1 MAG: hypothetical protein COX57_09845 [Alphaproteobacteria bacterium CG_4_10_14_0_2_um_filter_63_37]
MSLMGSLALDNPRVLFVSNFAEMVGGGEHSLLDLIATLRGRVEPILTVPAEGEVARRGRALGIPIAIVPQPPIGWRALGGIVAWLKAVRALKPDLIHANGSRSAFYAGIVGQRRKIPVLWHCRIADLDPRLDPILLKILTGIIANSHATARRFGPRPPIPVTVVHNGFDLAHCREEVEAIPRPEKGRVILAVARLSPSKRIEYLVDGFLALQERFPNDHLWIVGDDDPAEVPYAQATREKSRPLGERVRWVGSVADVRPWYRAADWLALPSRREAFGRVVVEAMALGVPVLAFAQGGVPEIVRQGVDGVLVEQDGLEPWIAGLERVLTLEETERAALGAAARERSESFSLQATGSGVLDVYRQLLKVRV